MKKIVLLFFLFVFMGCDKKSSVVPPIVEQPEPTAQLSIIPNGGVLPYGGTVTVSWTTANAKTVTLNNQPVGIADSKTERLFESTTYTLSAVNGKLSKTDQENVSVGDWTTSNTGLLVGKQWGGLLSTQYYTDGVLVSEPVLSDDQINRPFYFTINGDVIDTKSGGVICKWELKDNEKTLIMGPIYALIALSKTRLVRSREVTYNGKPSISLNTYWRPE